MESIFEKLEQNIFREMCEKAREYTSAILKEYDDEIFRCRDKKRFYVVGKEKTAVKTIYGEVEYTRRRYRERTESGDVGELYLLDHVHIKAAYRRMDGRSSLVKLPSRDSTVREISMRYGNQRYAENTTQTKYCCVC